MNLIENYEDDLLNSIPIVKGMKIKILQIEPEKVILQAPLNENINYEGTAFGGSLNTTCILSCYLLIHHILKQKPMNFKSLVIQNSQINYLHPVNENFQATASASPTEIQTFLKTLDQKGIARISVKSTVHVPDQPHPKVNFLGRFVARA